MAKLVFEVDDSMLEEAEMILDSIGLDMDMAFCIFVKKILKEKGLPFSMKLDPGSFPPDFRIYNENSTQENDTKSKRSNIVITEDMISEVWRTFKSYRHGVNDVKDLSELVAKKTGMSYGSALIYLNILVKLSKGEINKRAMKPTDFEFFLMKFKQEQGKEQFMNAIHSVELSIPYWRSNIPTFAESMELLLSKIEGK